MNRNVLDRLDRDVKECGDELEGVLQEIARLELEPWESIPARLIGKYADIKLSQEVLRNLRSELILLEIDKENGSEDIRPRTWFPLWNRKEAQ